MLSYMTANEAAQKWNISHRRVITLCKEERIPNTAMLGNMWIIPVDAVKPVDRRSARFERNIDANTVRGSAGRSRGILPRSDDSTLRNDRGHAARLYHGHGGGMEQ